jgi:cold shock CspA family protein
METPLEVDFQGMTPGLTLQDFVAEHVAGLETRFGRITACRVVVKGPGDHHRHGGPYEVNIHLALPNGREVGVDRTRHADERHADVRYAISDAFRRTRRQLEDQTRKLRGKVKHHEGPPTATVAKVDPSLDYGFLATADGREIYFHQNSLVDAAMSDLEPGTRVTFHEARGDQGPQASTVKVMGKQGPR